MLKSSENAVSPVVGVMLMLVVTIIIAAVVSGFAGGLVGNTQAAPNAVFDVEIKALGNAGAMLPWGSGYYTPILTIEELSGESIPTKDLSITMMYTNNSGALFSGTLNGEASVTGELGWASFGLNQACGVLYINDQSRFTDSTVVDKGGASSSWFGNTSAILMPGDILVTAAGFCGNYNDNSSAASPHGNPSMNYLLGCDVLDQREVGGFGTGSIVTVKIVHTPSGKIVYNKDVIVR
jgi:hypothetical protein